MFDVLSGDVSEAIYYYETTGTTGRATPCPRDGKEIIASNAHVTESWRAIFRHHFGERKPAIGLMGPTEVHSFGDTLGDVAKNAGSCNAKIWPYSPVVGFKKALQLMRDLRLEVVVATPGVCLNLARAAKHYGYDIQKDFSALKLFFVTGEMCTPALAKNIDTLWGVSTYNILYGSQEAFVMGVASPSRQMRLADINYVAEIINPDTGESLGDRGTGELCVTMLTDGVKPLIRYRTGDMVTINDDDHNEIDQPGPIIEVIGRVLDQVALGAGAFTAGTIEQAVLEGVGRCYGYQIVIDERCGQDELTIRMQFAEQPEHRDALEAGVIFRVHERFGVRATVEIVEDLDDIVSTGAFVSWKAARIVDNRRDRDGEEKTARSLSKERGIDT
jgi:phenylacetate-CoA ligase